MGEPWPCTMMIQRNFSFPSWSAKSIKMDLTVVGRTVQLLGYEYFAPISFAASAPKGIAGSINAVQEMRSPQLLSNKNCAASPSANKPPTTMAESLFLPSSMCRCKNSSARTDNALFQNSGSSSVPTPQRDSLELRALRSYCHDFTA